MNTGIILIGAAVLLVLYLVGMYNGFIILRTRIQEALSGIDVQLKRRADLIPNLVETVKGYAKHEKEIFENVTKARASMMNAGSLQEKAEANNQLSANTNFQDLQRQLEDTEDKVSFSRQFYNSNVLEFNSKVQLFPGSIIAGMFGFKTAEFFAATEEEKKKIDVKF